MNKFIIHKAQNKIDEKISFEESFFWGFWGLYKVTWNVD